MTEQLAFADRASPTHPRGRNLAASSLIATVGPGCRAPSAAPYRLPARVELSSATYTLTVDCAITEPLTVPTGSPLTAVASPSARPTPVVPSGTAAL